MKKLIVITVIYLSSIQTMFGQTKNEIDLITSGKWYLEYMINDGVKKTYPTELKDNNWMIFNSDGKHEVMSFSKLNYGKWEYSKDLGTIKMINLGRVSNHKIIKLNDNELILKNMNGGIEVLMKFKK